MPRHSSKRPTRQVETLAIPPYSLGWRIYRVSGEDIVYHGGWVEGYVADIAYSKSHRVGLVVLLNAESSVINEISTLFWSQLIQPVRELGRRLHDSGVRRPQSMR